MTHVYTITINNIVRYVGITNNIKRRTYEHNYKLRKDTNKDIYNYARSLDVDTLELEIIHSDKSRVECKRLECYMILDDYFGDKNLYQKVPSISDR